MIALLIQSRLLILSQLFLLSLCLHFAPFGEESDYAPLSPIEGSSNFTHESNENMRPLRRSSRWNKRPFDFWQWEGYGTYLEFLAGLIVLLGIVQIILGRWMW